jgi:hypothetical protein
MVAYNIRLEVGNLGLGNDFSTGTNNGCPLHSSACQEDCCFPSFFFAGFVLSHDGKFLLFLSNYLVFFLSF